MANLPSPPALLLQASELRSQCLKDYNNPRLIATVNSDIFEARRSPEVYNARRAMEDAIVAYTRQACRVLAEGALVVSSMEEIEALLVLLIRATPHDPLLSVVIKGPVPQGNVVDLLVAQMRATLEGEGIVLRHG
ncbi:uncharacterized protein LOC125315342 [Rhodamnia argentea]|uniref:Uncharacterized protein LOC125315342 n=1 Tax=Rhodamnia argentea TaxID=178133 RepID=A0ABM3HGR9_9MYRT|nr:uncharacterized protein LOC125315342 [Rhodamnia argentea]